MITEYFYEGRDNAIDVQLMDDSAVPGTLAETDLSSATKVGIIVDQESSYDSDTDPDVVSFTAGGIVSIKLGMTLAAGSYNVEIVVYDALNTNGVAWQPKIKAIGRESEPDA